MAKSNYIDWVLQLEGTLNNLGIEFSEYDEFFINEAIRTTEQIIEIQSLHRFDNLTEEMVDEYAKNAIQNDPKHQEYYETVAYYVKKRLLQT